jgi:REP element-mobilizing transposase RayT
MSVKYKIRNQDNLYFVTFTVVNWIDVFSRNVYKDLFIESLNFCIKEKGLKVYSFCIMTNHIHMIISTEGKSKLEDIIRDLKKYTSYRIIKEIEESSIESRKEWMLWMFKRAGKKNINNTNYQFWIQDNHPIELYNNEIMDQKLEYIHNNPVEAGIVFKLEDYVYSSASNYVGEKGILEVELIR